MRKIIAIGEMVLDTLFSGVQPVKSFVGGRVANAAASMAQAGVHCSMVSECTTDRVGDIVVDYLANHGVDVTSVDRYPDGATRLSAIFTDSHPVQIVNYGSYPSERFDVVWPRIDDDDIVLIGSLYAVDLPQRARLLELLRHAIERKAVIAYLPGLQHGISFRITHVMPNILENMEFSQLVIATSHDLQAIFPGESADECFRNHISFYGNTFVHIDSSTTDITIFNRDNRYRCPAAGSTADNMLGWQSGLTAGILHQMLLTGIGLDRLSFLTGEQWQHIIAVARTWADDSCRSDDNCISAEFAKNLQARK